MTKVQDISDISVSYVLDVIFIIANIKNKFLLGFSIAVYVKLYCYAIFYISSLSKHFIVMRSFHRKSRQC